MTTTLSNMTAKTKEPSAEEVAAKELVTSAVLRSSTRSSGSVPPSTMPMSMVVWELRSGKVTSLSLSLRFGSAFIASNFACSSAA